MKKVLAGHSAGGHLALLAGQHDNAEMPAFDKVIGLAAITDVATYAVGENSCQTATPAFLTAHLLKKPTITPMPHHV